MRASSLVADPIMFPCNYQQFLLPSMDNNFELGGTLRANIRLIYEGSICSSRAVLAKPFSLTLCLSIASDTSASISSNCCCASIRSAIVATHAITLLSKLLPFIIAFNLLALLGRHLPSWVALSPLSVEPVRAGTHRA
jgi:hypothetical protein